MTLPVPKYAIGDTFYVSRWANYNEPIQCPDCLGSKQWVATTPAGDTLRVNCARCNPYGHTETTPLSRQVCRGSVESVTVTGVIIDTTATDSSWQKSPVSYAAGCSRYDEARTFSTYEEAQAHADAMAAEEQAKLDAREAQQNAQRQASLSVTLAIKQSIWNSHYHAWAELRRVREGIDDWLKADDRCGCDDYPELTGDAQEKLREIVEPHQWLESKNPLNRLIPLLEAIVADGAGAADESQMQALAAIVAELSPSAEAR